MKRAEIAIRESRVGGVDGCTALTARESAGDARIPAGGRPCQMIAWRTFADTHSLTITVARITSRISETWVHASVEIELSSCRPMPPAPTSPSTVDSRMLMSQRNTEMPANAGMICGTIP